MSERRYPNTPLLSACTAIWRADKILLVHRGAGPSAGTWAMPGGLVEVGETLEQAAIREVREETALHIEGLMFNRFHEIIRKDTADATEYHYVLAMFATRHSMGDPVAGDDAAGVGWFEIDALSDLPLIGNTMDFVHESRRLLSIQ
jgi:ADP-ribose pyrophosphatase YjhB (NUDIX family)